MFSPQVGKLRPTEVKGHGDRVENNKNALQLAPARITLQRNSLFTDTSPAQVALKYLLSTLQGATKNPIGGPGFHNELS